MGNRDFVINYLVLDKTTTSLIIIAHYAFLDFCQFFKITKFPFSKLSILADQTVILD